jgi:autotransporter adhesin
MNKIYSSIWSTALGAVVAVSELASKQRKSAGGALVDHRIDKDSIGHEKRAEPSRRAISAAIAVLLGTGLFISEQASAQSVSIQPVGCLNVVNALYGIGIGCNTVAAGTAAVSVGAGAHAMGPNDVTVGYNAFSSGGDATAVGYLSRAAGLFNVALGAGATASGIQGAAAVGPNALAAAPNTAALGPAATAAGDQSTAIGYAAMANNDKDVALGASSTTAAAVGTSSTTINGTTYNFAGTTPGSTVSVGSAGAERTITNVAAGRISGTSTDAINGSQLYATNTAINTLGGVVTTLGSSAATALGGGSTYNPATGAITAPTYDVYGSPQGNVGAAIAALQNNAPLQYSTAAAPTTGLGANGAPVSNDVTLVGPNAGAPVTLHNVAAGTAPTDAANVSQLGSVVTGLGGGAAIDPATGAVTAPTYTTYNADGTTTPVNNVGAALDAINSSGIKYFHANSTAPDSQALGTDSVAIGPNAVANNAGDIALGSGSTTAAAVATPNTTINGTTYNFAGTAPTSTVSVGAPGAERTITNVAAGQISATSTDAINGSELYATNQAIAAVDGKSDGLGTSVANALGGGSTYDPATGAVTAPTYTTYNANGTTTPVNNVGAALDAINSSGIKYFHANSTAPDSQALGTDSVAIGPNAVANNAGDVALGSGSTTAAAVATPNTTINGTTYNFAGTAPTSTVSVGAPGAERTITNVAAGQISATSTDAINGSELYATNQAIAAVDSKGDGLGTSVADALGGGSTYDPATGAITAPSYNVYGSPQGNVGAAIAALQNNAPLQYSTAAAPTTGLGANGAPVSNDVTLVGPNAGAPVTLHNVAAGTAPTDAVNVSQLGTATTTASNKWIIGNPGTYVAPVAAGADSTAIGSGAQANGAGDVALGANTVSNGPDPTTNYTTANAVVNGYAFSVLQAPVNGAVAVGDRQITQVADGEISATSTDAVNGSQLFGIGQALSTQIANITPSIIQTLQSSGYTPIGPQSSAAHYFHVNSTLPDAQATGTDAVAIGPNATASGTNAVAMGTNATSSGNGSLALGANSNAPANNAVALGSGSTATRDNTVSVGAPGSERQITNVAAGVQPTDAVNMSQLNAATNQMQQSINDTARKAYAGVAAATALTMIPDVDLGKTIMVGAGAATYQGYAAVSLGFTARVTQNVKVRGGFSGSSAGYVVGGGVGYQW